MKKQLLIILPAVLMFLFSSTAIGGSPKSTSTSIKLNYILVEKNLLIGVNSNNLGLRTSSAYMLGEIKSSKALIPLLKMLRNEENKGARIMAALALYKIGGAIGINAVRQAARFDDDETVRKFCLMFYHDYALSNQ